jgi:hypothetical protein
MSLADLGRRAVACKHWRWMPGMTILGSKGRRVVVIGLSGATEATSGMNSRAIGPDERPDLSSPATLGCLLHLVREAWGRDAYIEVNKYERNGGRYLCDTQVGIAFPGQTEAEALVAALEAAP